jgi:ABC-type lipoprotein release transport system permease subunit
MTFAPADPVGEIQVIRDLQVLPLALGAFLALLAIGAVGHALSVAVRRRRHELAVLRALGMTRRQTRLAVAAQGTVLGLAGLAFGIPLGLLLGRSIWRVVAGFAPMAYHPPVAVWTLLLIGPAALLLVNVLAAWPQRQAARQRISQVLRTE